MDVTLSFPRVALITVDAGLRLGSITTEEDQPILRLVAAGFFMALTLLMPAAIEAIWRGCLAVRRSSVAEREPPLPFDYVLSQRSPDGSDSVREGGLHEYAGRVPELD
jgi:hypothetical protein